MQTFVHALYDVAARPSYIADLQEEIENTLGSDARSWTQEGLVRCIKLDSFVKESMRLNGMGCLWMPRLTLREFAFSDGTTVPKGTFLATAVNVIHRDESVYEDANAFKGFRFVNMNAREEQGRMPRITSPSSSFLAFGKGRHIW